MKTSNNDVRNIRDENAVMANCLLQLKVVAYINGNGFHEDCLPGWLVVEVDGGKVFDHSSRDLDYALQADGWLSDWTGGEWELTEKSLQRLRAAMAGRSPSAGTA